jgi:prevent-host-death family protein
MSSKTKRKTWNVTRLRANLAQAISESSRAAQVIEVSGQPTAVIIGIDLWRQLQQEQQRRQALAKMWEEMDKLSCTPEEEVAYQPFPRIVPREF